MEPKFKFGDVVVMNDGWRGRIARAPKLIAGKWFYTIHSENPDQESYSHKGEEQLREVEE